MFFSHPFFFCHAVSAKRVNNEQLGAWQLKNAKWPLSLYPTLFHWLGQLTGSLRLCYRGSRYRVQSPDIFGPAGSYERMRCPK